MKRKYIYSISLIVILIILASIVIIHNKKELNKEEKNYCTNESRGPGIYCIQVWEPVCGSDKKTYSNSCMACLNSSVEYYLKGECK